MPAPGFTYKEIVVSPSYQKEADSWSKVAIVSALIGAAGIGYEPNYTLGLHWIWLLPSLIFAISLFYSGPLMTIYTILTSFQSDHVVFEYPVTRPASLMYFIYQIPKRIINLANILGPGFVSWHLLKWLAQAL